MESSKLKSDNFSVCSLDTDVLLRWLLGDNQVQLKVVQDLLEKPSIKKIHISDVVVAEMVWVMESLYKLNRNEVVEAIQILIDSPKFVLNKILFTKLVDVYPESLAVSFIDMILVYYAQLNQAQPLITFDKKLSKKFDSVLLINQ